LEGGGFSMSHYTKEEWRQFIFDVLPEEKREEMENHLYSCDECLAVYMELIEQSASGLPTPSEKAISADVILEQAALDAKLKRMKKPQHKQKLLHYGIAAIITIGFMSSGIFQSATNAAVLGTNISKNRPSYTEQWMDKTLSFLDWLKPNKKEEGNSR
jgi:anti-sigma factor RsiW